MSDATLVEQFQQGDRSAFEELVRRYQDKVVATCVRMLRNKEDAEDAAQEVFVKVYDALGRFDPRAKLSTWLYRVTINHCLNVLRSRRIRRLFSLDQKTAEDDWRPTAPRVTLSSNQRPDDDLEKQEREWMVWRAIDTLPQSQKVAVVLAKFGGLSYVEVAEVMETSVSAVESILHRAKKNLHKRLSRVLQKE